VLPQFAVSITTDVVGRGGIGRLKLDGLICVLYGLLVLAQVVVSITTVVVTLGTWL